MSDLNNLQINQQKSDWSTLTDIVNLPSKGVFYEKKEGGEYIDHVLCEYMTAKDEAILLTPNLIKTNRAFDTLLSRKIKDRSILPQDLLIGDRNAILMFLRITAYGPFYEMTLISPYTAEPFNTTFNLNELKEKELTVAPDENLEFTYTTKDKKITVKFKLLISKEEDVITANAEAKMKVNGGINEIKTEKLKYQIKEVNGKRGGMIVSDFIETCSPKIAKEIENYISEVTPGLDMKSTFICPSTGKPFQSYIPITSEFFYPES